MHSTDNNRAEKSSDGWIWEAAWPQVYGRKEAIAKEFGEAEIKDSR